MRGVGERCVRGFPFLVFVPFRGWGFLVESVPDSIHLCTSLRWIGSLERSSLPSREAIYSISELFELPISADWGQGVDATFPTQTST